MQSQSALSVRTGLQHTHSSARRSPSAHIVQSELITQVREALESSAVLCTHAGAQENRVKWS